MNERAKETLTVAGVVALMIGIGIAGLTLPRMPWEAPSTYCGRIHPIDSTKQHACVEEYTMPSKAITDWLRKNTQNQGTDAEYICMGKVLEEAYDTDELREIITEPNWTDPDYARNVRTYQSLKACVRE